VFLVTFALAWMIPGNPLEQPDRRPPPEIEQAMLRQYNLDNPWRFARSYVVNVVFHGDFGPSLHEKDLRVSEIITHRLPVSAAVGLAALAVALLGGLGAGVLGAVRPGSVLEMGSLGVALVGVSLPTFVTGSVLLPTLHDRAGELVRGLPGPHDLAQHVLQHGQQQRRPMEEPGI